jgi:hypothetical protein
MTQQKSLKEKIIDYGSRSTVNGIPNILTTDRISVRIIWILCLLVSAGYCSRICISNLLGYLQYDVETVVEILRDSEAEFPTVTFCNLQLCDLNEYRLINIINSQIKDNLNKLNGTNITAEMLREQLANDNLNSIFKVQQEAFFKYYSKRDLDRILYNNQRVSIKNSIISCQYSSEFCNENDFEYITIGQFKKCYRFNAGRLFNGSQAPIRKARRYGKNYGLQLELFIGFPSICKSPLSSTIGLKVYVHNKSYLITDDEKNDILVTPGTEANIAIDRTFVYKKPYPYSNCIDNELMDKKIDSLANANYDQLSLVDKTIKSFKMYTQQSCQQICFQDYLVKNYRCYDESLPIENIQSLNLTKCATIDPNSNNTIVDYQSVFFSTDQDKYCLENCPTGCLHIKYDATVSSSQFPTLTYADVLVYNENVSSLRDKSFEVIESSVLSFNVYYKSDLYTKIREKESTSVDVLVSNFGGTMGKHFNFNFFLPFIFSITTLQFLFNYYHYLGLFLGISLLSFVEIIEILWEIIASFFENKTQYINQSGEITVQNLDQ